MKFKSLHEWNVTPKKAVDIQKRLAQKILLKNTVRKLNYIGGVDVSYRDGISFACACILRYPNLRCVEYKTASCETKFPYIPGLLTFREGPVIIKCIKKIGVVLRTRDNTNPIFISPGHKIDLSASIEIVLKSLRGFRIPEPLRLAHHYSNSEAFAM